MEPRRYRDPPGVRVGSTEPSGGASASVVLSEGDVSERRFDKGGTFERRCEIHPEMKGKVRVR